MSFQIRGWHSQVVEVAYEDDPTAFFEALHDEIPLRMWITQLSAGGGPVMAPMVDGQIESVTWLRVECPAYLVTMTYAALEDALRRHFPRPPAG